MSQQFHTRVPSVCIGFVGAKWPRVICCNCTLAQICAPHRRCDVFKHNIRTVLFVTQLQPPPPSLPPSLPKSLSTRIHSLQPRARQLASYSSSPSFPRSSHPFLPPALSATVSSFAPPGGMVSLCFGLSQLWSLSSPAHRFRQGSRCLLESAARLRASTSAFAPVCEL